MIKRVSSLLRKKPPVTADKGFLSASGPTVPGSGTSGFQPGALFQDTSTGKVYVNEGTLASSSFKAFLASGNSIAVNDLIVSGAAFVSGILQAPSLSLIQDAPAVIADGNTAITIGNILSKILTMAATTARAPTVPTGSAVALVISVGRSMDWSFINLAAGAHTITVTAATGHTLVGKMTLAQNESGRFRTRHSTLGVAITYRLA